MPDEVCALGNPFGIKTYISADCGRPRPEFKCQSYTCCDACYTDSVREQELDIGDYAEDSDEDGDRN